ncbi:MAG: Methylmalonyl-CoA mutase [Syntrophorhabdus sp. PtaU1.Bin058]|nr:MAG: Methylmalonyl-CoA mutase [Syntrophorhabdus sp. PtaU1.Bin058]
MPKRQQRIIMAKMGLDSHDNGLRIVSKWLADSGYEVIYAGVYNSAERILQMTIEEGADAIGLSFLGGEHLHYTGKLLEMLRTHDLGHVKFFAGGIIPPADVVALKDMGVDAVFTPGAQRREILSVIGKCLGVSEDSVHEK